MIISNIDVQSGQFGLDGNDYGICNYFGQVDEITGEIPDGIGLAMQSGGTFLEGQFQDGRPTTYRYLWGTYPVH